MDREDELQPINKLSPRMRECLRLVHARKSSKKIAQVLVGPSGKPLTPGTIDNYIAQAVQLLGAADRFEAADIFSRYEGIAPSGLQVQPSGVVVEPPLTAIPRSERLPWWRSLPFRSNGATSNDLTILQRLFWIPALAIAFAIGFGMLAVGVHVISDLVRSGSADRRN